MKHKLLFALAIIAFITNVNAQLPGNVDYNIWNPNVRDTFYVYGKTANVRTEPNLTAAIQDSLSCGAAFIIQANEKQFDQVKGIHAPWVKGTYNINGAKREGFMWVGLLSLGNYVKDSVRFIYGIERIANSSAADIHLPATWFLRVKAISAMGKIIDEKEWKMDGPEIAATGGKLLGDMGLKNTTDIIRVHFGGEACGVPLNYFYYAWTGKKLLPLPSKMSVGDAGVYYYNETFLFPKEPGGQPDKIIKLSEESEAGEQMEKNGEPIFKTTHTRTVYSWDGVKAVKVK